MNWKKFTGPGVLAGVAFLILVVVNVLPNMMYDEGDTVHPGFVQTSCCMGLISILMCLSSIVWLAFALGSKTQKTVFLAQNPNEFQHVSVPLAGDAQSTVVPSTIGGGPMSYVREKIIIEKSEGDTSQIVGFMILVGSVVMFVLMIILGFIWILSGMGSGLGGPGGTCNETCESWGSAAKFSMWAAILLFPCGLIALARPWSWFRSTEDLNYPGISSESTNDNLEFENLTMIELKTKLREVGLPVSGKKAELVLRLTEFYQESLEEKLTAECVECRATLRFPADYSGKIQCPRCKTFHRV